MGLHTLSSALGWWLRRSPGTGIPLFDGREGAVAIVPGSFASGPRPPNTFIFLLLLFTVLLW